MNYRQILLFLIIPLLCGPLVAADVTIHAENLQGMWVKESKSNCGTSAAEYVLFHGNGTMEAGRGTEPRSVGFWVVSGNTITLHMLVVPMEDDATNVFYRGRYSYSYLTADVVSATNDAVEILTGTTGNMKNIILAKCR